MITIIYYLHRKLYGRKKDGGEFPVDIALGPLQTKDDIVVLAVVRDFTERKQREAEGQRLNELLEIKIRDLAAANKELESVVLFLPMILGYLIRILH